MEVEVREQSEDAAPDDNSTQFYTIPEVLLVVLVLLIWVAAIALFFNRWGKIRMLEPYQPKFHQQPHRPSCPMAPLSPPPSVVQVSRTHKMSQRMSFSKYNINAMTDPLSALPSPIIRRPRQNSVFVGGSSAMAILNPPPRRAKSAMDIQHLIVNERIGSSSWSGSKGTFIPILNRDRRPSITVERPPRARRASCAPARACASLEHPRAAAARAPRKHSLDARPPASRSFEQPRGRGAPPARAAASLDEGRGAIAEEEAAFIEETRITAPLLEALKSSDV